MFLGKLMYRKLNIEELVNLAQKDDFKALEELIKREQKNVYLTFMYLCKDSQNIQDLTQEALLRMAKSIGSLKNPKTFKSWLNQIVTNLFYDDLRKKSKSLKTVSYDIEDNENLTTNPIVQIVDKKSKPLEKCLFCELDNVIKNEINSLPKHFKVPIILRELQGLSYEDIAKVTNTNVGTVKSRIARARTKLQDGLKNYI